MSAIVNMQYGTRTATISGTAGFYSTFCRLGRIGVNLLWALRSYLVRRRAEWQLRALDDRMLKDIGIDRSEIDTFLFERAIERRRGIQISPSRAPCIWLPGGF